MNVLVTGGAGYIGSVVTADLVRSGHRVWVYDNLSHGYREAVHRSAALIVGELADTEKVSHTLRTHAIDACMHFAAFIEAGESMQVPERYFRNNTACTLSLLECLLAAGVRKLVFSSTAAVYGDPEDIPISEGATLSPTNAYGASKLLVEQMLSWLSRVHGLRYASLRYFNAAGATPALGENHQPESHLIPLMLQVALGQRPHISLFGTDYPTIDGTCVRDYIHVSDLAAAHLLALQALDQHQSLIYNLGNGQGFTVRQVLDVVRKVTGHPVPAVEAARRAGDPAILVASSEKIQRELGWKPQHAELETIVKSAWVWRRAHPNGYGQPVPAATQG